MILLLALLACDGVPANADESLDALHVVAELPLHEGALDTVVFDDVVVTSNGVSAQIVGIGAPGELAPLASLGLQGVYGGIDLEVWNDGVWGVSPIGLSLLHARDGAVPLVARYPELVGDRLAFGPQVLAIAQGDEVRFVPIGAIRDGTATAADIVSTVLLDTSSFATALYWQGDTLFVGTSTTGALVYDVSNPAAPVLIRQIGREWPCFVIAPVGELLAIGVDTDAVLWDVSDLADPRPVSTLRGLGHAVHPRGDVVIGTDGINLVITDVSDPAKPLGVVRTVPTDAGILSMAVTDTDVFVSAGFLLVRMQIDEGTPPAAPIDCYGSDAGCFPIGLPDGAEASTDRGTLGAQATGDLDGDGQIDLVLMTPDQAGGGLVLFGPLPEDGTFDIDDEALMVDGAGHPWDHTNAVAVGDVDDDGQDDLVMSGDGDLYVAYGPLDGPGVVDVGDRAAFQYLDVFDGLGTGAVAIVGDTDGNGISEIAVASAAGGVAWLVEAPDSRLVGRLDNDAPSGGIVEILAVPDTDGDGLPEVALAWGRESDNGLTVDGGIALHAGPWSGQVVADADLVITKARTRLDPTGEAIAVADAGQDGVPDLLVGASGAETVHEGMRAIALDRRGLAEVANEPVYSVFSYAAAFNDFFPAGISVGEDYDGDGAPDILATHRHGQTTSIEGADAQMWFYPDLDARFADPSRVDRRRAATLGDTRWELVPDLTGDGVGDLIAVGGTLTIVSGEALR